MGKIWFSASKGGFYHEGACTSPPIDAVEITPAAFARLFAEQAGGKVIVASGGKPAAVTRPEPSWPEAWARIHRRRNQLLRDSDWTQTLDCPLSEAERAAWASYRQALRDLPSTTTDPMAIVWPIAPT